MVLVVVFVLFELDDGVLFVMFGSEPRFGPSTVFIGPSTVFIGPKKPTVAVTVP